MKSKKRIISILLTAILMASMMPLSSFASTTDKWDGFSIDTSWYTSDPTASQFIITKASELAGLAQIVNGTAVDDSGSQIGANAFVGQEIILGNDIDLDKKEWTPIGTFRNGNGFYFEGTFDGKGNTISNLGITKSSSAGFIGQAASGAHIKNVGIVDCSIDVSEVFRARAGALIANGTYVEVTNCYSTGEILAEWNTGGLIGNGRGCSVLESYSTVNVTATEDYIGGLIGYGDDTTVTNCYYVGSVSGRGTVGGLIGSGYDFTLKNSYAAATVSGNGLGNAGGLVGATQSDVENSYGNSDTPTGTFRETNGTSYLGSANGGATLDQMKEKEFKDQLNTDLADSSYVGPFAIDSKYNDGFPYLTTIMNVMEGNGQTIKQGEPLAIRITTPYVDGIGDDLTLELGGVEISKENITFSPGSTVLTVSGDYTAKLDPGNYSFVISSAEYGTNTDGIFTLTEAAEVTPTPVPESGGGVALVPDTGDDTNIFALITVAIMSIVGVYVIGRKCKHNL